MSSAAGRASVRFHRIPPICRHFRSAVLTAGKGKFSGNSFPDAIGRPRAYARPTRKIVAGASPQAPKPKGALATGPRRCMSRRGPHSYCFGPFLSVTAVTCGFDFPRTSQHAGTHGTAWVNSGRPAGRGSGFVEGPARQPTLPTQMSQAGHKPEFTHDQRWADRGFSRGHPPSTLRATLWRSGRFGVRTRDTRRRGPRSHPF